MLEGFPIIESEQLVIAFVVILILFRLNIFQRKDDFLKYQAEALDKFATKEQFQIINTHLSKFALKDDVERDLDDIKKMLADIYKILIEKK